MKINKLACVDGDASRLTAWLDRGAPCPIMPAGSDLRQLSALLLAGVADALQKKYLKTLLFRIAQDAGCNRLLEVNPQQPSAWLGDQAAADLGRTQEYVFSFSYDAAGQVAMHASQGGRPLSQARGHDLLARVRAPLCHDSAGAVRRARAWTPSSCRSYGSSEL